MQHGLCVPDFGIGWKRATFNAEAALRCAVEITRITFMESLSWTPQCTGGSSPVDSGLFRLWVA